MLLHNLRNKFKKNVLMMPVSNKWICVYVCIMYVGIYVVMYVCKYVCKCVFMYVCINTL